VHFIGAPPFVRRIRRPEKLFSELPLDLLSTLFRDALAGFVSLLGVGVFGLENDPDSLDLFGVLGGVLELVQDRGQDAL
jgi:hypothetical protein